MLAAKNIGFLSLASHKCTAKSLLTKIFYLKSCMHNILNAFLRIIPQENINEKGGRDDIKTQMIMEPTASYHIWLLL